MGDKEMGQLVWQGFYGPPRNIFMTKDFLPFVLFMSFFLFLIGFFLVISNGNPDSIEFGWMAIITGCLLPIILISSSIIWILKSKQRYDLTRAGKLDWDIYENGISASFLSETAVESIEKRFIPFAQMTNVYINVNKKNMKSFIEKLKERDENKLDDDQSGYSFLETNEDCVRDNVWLLTSDEVGYYEMDKSNFRDLKRFENIIRQKVKDVE